MGISPVWKFISNRITIGREMDIQPDKQNIDKLFSSTVYHIDFYQRDYKWSEEPVKRLMDDIFYQFDEVYDRCSDLEPNKENINSHYPWYYLNTYVTNNVGGREFVVDGQQRLTTLTLMLIKLYLMAKDENSKTERWVELKISGFSGTEHEFWMNHVRHINVFSSLLDGEPFSSIDTSSGITAVNMVKNYQVISSYFDEKLFDKRRLETFIFYFLLRLVLINLAVDTKQVPMVFEVINDRGVRLKPYEILKGKLLGQIDKAELESNDYNGKWEEAVSRVNAFREDEIDSFFRYWLKAKHTTGRKEGQRFDGDYHREMLKPDMNSKLRLDHDAVGVKDFLDTTFSYYTKLYEKIWEATGTLNPLYPAVHFNALNGQDSQFMLIMSACKTNDEDEDSKIHVVSVELDKAFSLLQLQGAYDSNSFSELLFRVSSEIRDQKVADIPVIFSKHFMDELVDNRSLQNTSPLSFNYNLFKNMTIDRMNKRFIRYFLGRVDMFIAQGMRLEMKHSLKDLVSLSGAKTGFHVEHIFANNDTNIELFGDDLERFEQERNRLGGVLLLKGIDNISSNAEGFDNKLKTYANTLYWNETLREDTYKSKLDFRDFIQRTELAFKPYSSFGPAELEERHKLLFDLCDRIWNQGYSCLLCSSQES